MWRSGSKRGSEVVTSDQTEEQGQHVCDLDHAKADFRAFVAASNSIQAALQHNPTYGPSVDEKDKHCFRVDWATLLASTAAGYRSTRSDDEHCTALEIIADSLSNRHASILLDGRLRIGAVQKAFNLYLKFMWCMEHNRPAPPHCPIDRPILEYVGIRSNWTAIKDISTYRDLIESLRSHATSDGYSSLAEWELKTWERLRATEI